MTATHTRMSLVTRAVLGFIAVNALAGGLTLMLFPASTDTLFFWTITPSINAALFGALYLSGAIAVAWLTYRGAWEPARFLIPVLVSAGILISITTLLHLDRFSPGIKLIYWLVIYIGAPLLALGLYAYEQRRGGNWAITQPIAPATRTVALVTGAIIVGAGLLVLIQPAVLVSVWPWSIAPLMVRVFASWFSAFGVGLLWFGVERDWGRMRYLASLMIVASVLDLLMIFLHRQDITAPALNVLVYCFHLAGYGLVGLLMHWLQRRSARVNLSSSI